MIPIAGNGSAAGTSRFLLHDERALDPRFEPIEFILLDPPSQPLKLADRDVKRFLRSLRRGTRAERGSTESAVLAPIEIEVPRATAGMRHVEIAIDSALLRVEVGADVEYVGALVRQLRGSR